MAFKSDKEHTTTIWETPQHFFDELDKEFHFTLDPCSTDENAKCKHHYTERENGLVQNWEGQRVFCNPPYGREMPKWIAKCDEEKDNAELIVLLIPSRTDTKAFHEYIYGKAELRFVKGRLKFGGSNQPAPFPSMICIWHKS